MENINWEKLGFSATRTSSIMVAYYRDGKWSPAQKTEDFSITMDVYAQVMHYAVSCFEGMKAFRQKSGEVAIFRPDENAARMARTAAFLGMPVPPADMFVKMCEDCVRENIEFLPPYGQNASMYLRPLLIGSHPQLQLLPYPEAVFMVMCTPVGSYHGASMKSFNAVIPGNYDRAAPKGSGSYKVGANYASTFRPYSIAHEQGYSELLFPDATTRRFVDEYGSSNFFAIKGNTYVTPLSDSVLPSITNKSLQQVASDMGMKVEKRQIPLDELSEMDEVGACGTAVVVTPIYQIDVKPVLEESAVEKTYSFGEPGTVGKVSAELYRHLTGIQYGEIEDKHSWCHKVTGCDCK